MFNSMKKSFGLNRGSEVIDRRVELPGPSVEQKTEVLDAIIDAVRAAQELGLTPYEVDSAVRGFNTAAGSEQPTWTA